MHDPHWQDDPPTGAASARRLPVAELTAHLRIGEWIATEREDRGLSQRDLARAAGIRQPTLCRIERGTRLPSLATLSALLDAMDLQLSLGAEPRWADVDAAISRLQPQRLERRLEDWDIWLCAMGNGARPVGPAGNTDSVDDPTRPEVPMALGGALGAMLLGLPVEARKAEIFLRNDRESAERFCRFYQGAGLAIIDPRTGLQRYWMPDPDELLEEGQMTFLQGLLGIRVEVNFVPWFEHDETVWVSVFDDAIPVLPLHRLTSSDPWVRRVLARMREAEHTD